MTPGMNCKTALTELWIEKSGPSLAASALALLCRLHSKRITVISKALHAVSMCCLIALALSGSPQDEEANRETQ